MDVEGSIELRLRNTGQEVSPILDPMTLVVTGEWGRMMKPGVLSKGIEGRSSRDVNLSTNDTK